MRHSSSPRVEHFDTVVIGGGQAGLAAGYHLAARDADFVILSADARVSNVYLGHTWYEGDTEEAVGKTIVRNSILGAHIRAADPWAPTTRATPKNPTPAPAVLYTSDDYYAPGTGLIPTEAFLAEFGNSGPGAAN